MKKIVAVLIVIAVFFIEIALISLLGFGFNR